MRMVHYFTAAAVLLTLALFAVLWTGLFKDAGELHLWTGLLTGTLGVGTHTLVILFVLITGRVLREAMRARELSAEFLQELNTFFAEKRAYPLAILGAFSLVTAGVLGMSARGFGISPAWHMLIGGVAVLLNLWTLTEELRVLRANQGLIDRVASELDRIDASTDAAELAARAEEAERSDPRAVGRLGLTLAIAAWLPYLYWGLITWRGDFSRVSIHPWIEGSLLGLGLWWLGRGASGEAPREP